MIDIAFSESARGGLVLAQSFGRGAYKGNGPIGLILRDEDDREPTQAELEEAQRQARERHRKAWEAAIPLGGRAGDVFGFALGLSLGDILDPLDAASRLEAFRILNGMWDANLEETCRRKIQKAAQDLSQLRQRIEAGEDARIWYSHSPDEACGFYWLMDQLRGLPQGHGALYALCQPLYAQKENTITEYSGWGGVAPGEFGHFLHLAEPISGEMMRYYSNRWKCLQEENAFLRATVNGRLSSVPGNLYDGYIQAELALQGDEFYEAALIGSILGKHNPGVGDGFLHHRIEKRIQSGALEVVALHDAFPSYRQISIYIIPFG